MRRSSRSSGAVPLTLAGTAVLCFACAGDAVDAKKPEPAPVWQRRTDNPILVPGFDARVGGPAGTCCGIRAPII